MSICYAVTLGMEGIAEDYVRFAHYGPSHNLLRPANGGTRILRAPPPARVRGWTRLRNPFHPSGCILPIPLSHCHPPGRILPIVFSRLHSPIIILPVTFSYYIPPIPSSHLHPLIVIILPHCHRNTLPLTISLWYSLTSTLFSHTC